VARAVCDGADSVPRKPVPDKALAAALKRLRDKRNWTQERLAYEAGITAGSYARIELGQAAPAWSTVRQIAKALDVSLMELATAVEAEQRSG
jgi:transcriptional regulator with XRE-family HTH domain